MLSQLLTFISFYVEVLKRARLFNFFATISPHWSCLAVVYFWCCLYIYKKSVFHFHIVRILYCKKISRSSSKNRENKISGNMHFQFNREIKMHQEIDDDDDGEIFEPERNFPDVFSNFTLELIIKGNTIEFSPI